MLLIKRTTKSTSTVVLTFDPAVVEANEVDQLAAYRETGEGIEIPDGATRFEIRPLSLEERISTEDAADDVEFGSIRAIRRKALAVVRLGLVAAVQGGERIEGAEDVLRGFPDAAFYPAVLELWAHIVRLSTVDPGKD